MKREDAKIGARYKSRVNPFGNDLEYEVLKINKTTCWVKLWESGTPTKTIYKNVPYRVLRIP